MRSRRTSKETDRQASRLLKRVTAIEAPLLAVKQGTKLSSSESLRQLLATVEKAHGLLAEYTLTGKITRALKRKEYADKFRYLGVILTEGMLALHLDVAVETWAREDATDRLDDLEHMMELVEEMEHNRRGNHNEVMAALKVNIQDAPVRYIDMQCFRQSHIVLLLFIAELHDRPVVSPVLESAK